MVLLSSASVVAGATFLVACGDDTSVTTSTEAGADAQSDAPNNPETSPGDAGADTAPPFDGGFKVDTFDSVIATEFCGALARCCYGSPTPADGGLDGGGSFDRAKCERDYVRIGFEGSNANSDLRDAGNVGLDQVAADTCISKIKAMTCDLPGTEFKAIRAACYGAYAGKVAVGGACKEAIECAPGHFCNGGSDGGTGKCEALRALNGNCGDFTADPAQGDRACSYRAGGDTGNYCKFYDIGGGVELDRADWKCTAGGAAGSDCATSLWCKDTICTGAGTCETPHEYFAGACEFYKVP